MSATRPRASWLDRTPALLGVVLLVALGARLVALPVSTEAVMDADSAHLMNVARCFERGQGFANPAAWPAWMKPERLPMPETFKEPAYSWLVAQLAPRVGGEFRAGVLVAFLAGLLLPVVLWALARNLGFTRREAALAALLVAVNPLSVSMSVRVMVDSLFPALLTLAFALAAWRPAADRARPPSWDVATGIVTGLAFMTRAQTLVALPAIVLFLLARPRRAALRSIAVTVVIAGLAASPFLLRNLRLFGTPFHSDVGAYGLWPYVDHITFSHGLDRPPPPIAFALAHLPEVLAHWVRSAVRFATAVLPQDVGGHPVWMVPLGAGLVLAVRRWRALLAPAAYLVATYGFVFAVNWDARYLTSTVPLWALLIALGAAWLARPLADAGLWGRLRGRHLLLAALALTCLVQVVKARRDVAPYRAPELEAARAEAPFLRRHLAPDEAVMVVTTSWWSWFADRPSVHLVIADEPRFLATVRRLKVRWAALPTSRLPVFAARFPGGRLPAALVYHHAHPERDVTVFRVVDPAGR